MLVGYYVGVSLLTFMAYGYDKNRAASQGWRVPESTLHMLSLLGGWPGALVGQQVFRHKRRKGSFMVVFWLTAILHCACVYGYTRFLVP